MRRFVRIPLRRLVCVPALIGLTLLPSPDVEAQTVNPCIGKKLACVSALAVAHDGCYAKAAKAGKALDPVCTQKARDKFAGPKGCIAKAEKKPGCLTTGDADALATAVEIFVGDLVAMLDPGFPTGLKNKCTGGKHGCVATKVKGLLRCHVKAAKKGVLDPTCTAKAIAKFDGGSKPAKACFTKLESKGGCVTTGDRDALELLADDFVRTVVCALDAAAPLCGLATPTPTPAPTVTVTPIGSAGTPETTGSPTPSPSPSPETLPPDPVTIAPPVDPGVPAAISDATEFLYTGANPIQTGVAPTTIDPTRVAVLRGRVLTRDGEPLQDVTVTILNHPELGQTLTRPNGVFDLAVNGGGDLVVSYERTGFLPAQRQIYAPWNDYAIVPTVVLIALDAQVTAVDLTAGTPMQVARGGVATDADGSRQATVLFPQGTTATMVFPNGSTQPLTALSVRATEFTVGANGPAAMPAELPATSGYTYCAELSIDEALAAGAATVEFSAPLPFYVENFLGFPIGMDVPLGSYDRSRGVWIPEATGKVIEILSVTGNQADVDSDGDGIADALLGMSDAERQQLATLYAPGQSLQRMLVTHFTPYDANMPVVPPPDAIFPQDDPEPEDLQDNVCEVAGNSVIECQNQILRETIGVVGTGFGLQYQSDRARGYLAANTLEIPLSGALPASILGIELDIEVAGRQFHRSFPPTPNQRTTFTWDGKDAYGRFLDGPQPITVRINYVYPAVYAETSRFGDTPASSAVTVVPGRERVKLSRIAPLTIGTYRASSAGLGGWSLTPHHAYVPTTQVLYRGDGRRESASARDTLGPIITAVTNPVGGCLGNADGGQASQTKVCPEGVAIGPDGSVYIASFDQRVRRIGPDGVVTTVAGTGIECAAPTGACGDGGPATAAPLNRPWSLAVGPDGSLYIGEIVSDKIRKVDPSGTITTIAGNGNFCPSAFDPCGDGGPSEQSQLHDPLSRAVGPDNALYIADSFTNRVRRIGPDGIITTVAGTGTFCSVLPSTQPPFCGEGGPATAARLTPRALDVGRDGSIYIVDGGDRVRRIGPDGIIRTIAGTFKGGGSNADGVPAVQAELFLATAVAVDVDDTIYVGVANNLIRSFRPGGQINTVAGIRGVFGSAGNGGPARRATVEGLDNQAGLRVGPDGGVYFTQRGGSAGVRRIAPIGERFLNGERVIPSVDGSEVFLFTQGGQHLRTVDALTGTLRYAFTYDAAGRLATVTDRSDNVTTVERDAQGEPTGILGPFGKRTLLALDADGNLSTITNPASEAVQLDHTASGLLSSVTKPGGQTSSYDYDGLGRLIAATDPTDETKTLTRVGTNRDHTITLTSPLGRTSTFRAERLSNRDTRLTTTDAAGAQSQLLIGQNGIQSSTTPDGTTTSLTLAPDPRWGMRAPIPATLTTTTPGGRTRTITMQRAVTFAGPSALLNLTTLTDTFAVNGRIFTSTYGGGTRTLTATWPTGRQQSVVFDTDGRIAQVQLGDLEPTLLGYDAHGRLATATRGSGGDARTVTFAYESGGFLQSVTDPLARAVSVLADDAGRVTQVTQPGGDVIGVASDPNGNVVSLTPPGRPSHTFGYTARDQVSAYTAPAVGNEGRDAAVTYDADRLPTQFDHPDAGTSTAQYDSAGRLSVVDVASHQYTYGYDAASRPTSVDTTQGIALANGFDGSLATSATWSGAVAGSITRSYDGDFRVATVSVNGSDALAIQYDTDGLPSQVGALVLTRDAQTALLTGTTLGAFSDAMSYDGFGQPAAYSASHDGSAVYAVTYGRDLLERITSKSETISGVTHVLTYTYDLDGRLKEVRQDGALTATYAYDGNGNRVSVTGPGGTVTASHDARDRLIQSGTTTFVHNPRGELVSKTTGNQTTTYAYDGVGGLTGVTLPNGTTVDYLLDGSGRRLGRKVDATLVQGFLYESDLQPSAELDGAGAVVSRFVYANAGNVPAYMIKGGATYRIVTDQLGSPRVVIDVATGQIAQLLEHDEFGRVVLDTNPGFQPFGFAGGLYDPVTKLVHFGAREYDPDSGRWTTRDPIGFSGGINLYAYVANDPINLVDPSGNGTFFQVVQYQPAPPMNPVAPAPAPPPLAPPAPPPPPPPTNPFGPANPNTFRLASQPVYQVPVAAEGSGTVAQCTRVAQVLRGGGSVALAFAVGYGIGTAINQTFDISGKASDRGVRVQEAFLESGYTEGTADFFGVVTTLGFLSPDGARAIDTVLSFKGY